MIIQLTFILTFPAHLRHIFQRIEYSSDNPLIRRIHICPYFQIIGLNELFLNSVDISRKLLHEVGYTSTFLSV